MIRICNHLIKFSRNAKLYQTLSSKPNELARKCQMIKPAFCRTFSTEVLTDQTSKKRKIKKSIKIPQTFKAIPIHCANRVWNTYFWELRDNPDYSPKIVPGEFAKKTYSPYKVQEGTFLNIVKTLEDSLAKKAILTCSEVKTLLEELLKHGNDMEMNEPLLSWLDTCCSENKWTLEESFYVFDALNIITGDWFLRRRTYLKFSEYWLSQKCFSNSDLCLISYFLTAPKLRTPENIRVGLYNALNTSDLNFTPSQWILLCHCFFKMSFKLENKEIIHALCKRFEHSFEDISTFDKITIIKALRHSMHCDKSIVETIANDFHTIKYNLNLIDLAHFVSFFSNLKIYDPKLFAEAEKMFLRKLDNPISLKNNSEEARCKDLSRILWCFSAVNHTPQNEHFYSYVMKYLRENPKFANDTEAMVDLAQSFTMLNIYSKSIIDFILSESFFSKVHSSKNDKPKQQFRFFYESVKIEAPSHLPKDFEPTLERIASKSFKKETKERSELLDLAQYLEHFTDKQSKMKYLLPHISMLGIIFSVDRNGSVVPKDTDGSAKVAIELLDPTVCLSDSNFTPAGLMSTKIRQLKKKGYIVICVNSKLMSELKTSSMIQRNEFFSSLVKTQIENLLQANKVKEKSPSENDRTTQKEYLHESEKNSEKIPSENV